MDTIMTLWQLRNLVWTTKEKFLHFNKLYDNAINDYHKNVLTLKSVNDYVKGRDSEEVNRIYRMFKGDIRVCKSKLAFAQDEIRMYKHEMQKWRDISIRLQRAYWDVYDKLEKVWHVNEDGQFGRWLSKRFIGADTKLHLRITWCTTTGCHHQVMVSLLDKKFGVLTNEHCY